MNRLEAYLFLFSSKFYLQIPWLVDHGTTPGGVAVTSPSGCHLHLLFYVVINVLLLFFDVRTEPVDPRLRGLVPGGFYVGAIGFRDCGLERGRAGGGQLFFQRGHFFLGQCGSLEQWKRNY